ncbi:MAG: DUF488 domain-containing protein [Halothece sp. Uz-M2-17]|nr:DUF488 domain-containing protein [Halothece sp. Uz-M2-17]
MSYSIQSNQNLVLTFGYGNRKSYDTLLEYIKKYNITCIVDVRLSPRAWSRKWYGDAIEKLCSSKNITYMSKTSLGNISGNSHWIPPEQEEADKTLSEIAEISKGENILLLCAEMNCAKCHRTEIAHKLHELSNATVKHLE